MFMPIFILVNIIIISAMVFFIKLNIVLYIQNICHLKKQKSVKIIQLHMLFSNNDSKFKLLLEYLWLFKEALQGDIYMKHLFKLLHINNTILWREQ